MTRRFHTSGAVVAALAACLGAALQARAGEPAGLVTPSGTIQVVGSDSSSRFVQLGIGKSVVIDLPRDIKDVLVAEPKFANAVVRSTRRAYLIGVAVGQTNIYFFDADGKQIAGFDVAVTRDLNGIRATMPETAAERGCARRRCRRRRDAAGSVANAGESQQAADVAARLVGDLDKVVNNLTIRGRDQVMLKVTVAEVQRDIIKQLGIDLNGTSLSYRQCGSQLQQFQSVHGARTAAGRRQRRSGLVQGGQRDAQCDGARGRHPHVRRTDADGDFG